MGDVINGAFEVAKGIASNSHPETQLVIIGVSILTLKYFEFTEPYATILRKLKLDKLIDILTFTIPGSNSKNIREWEDAIDCCLTEYHFAGITPPPELEQMKNANTVWDLVILFERLVPGSGFIEDIVLGAMGSFTLRTATQLLGDAAPKLKERCRFNTARNCDGSVAAGIYAPISGAVYGGVVLAGPFDGVTPAFAYAAAFHVEWFRGGSANFDALRASNGKVWIVKKGTGLPAGITQFGPGPSYGLKTWDATAQPPDNTDAWIQVAYLSEKDATAAAYIVGGIPGRVQNNPPGSSFWWATKGRDIKAGNR